MCPPMTMKSQCDERSAFHCHLMGRANMFRPSLRMNAFSHSFAILDLDLVIAERPLDSGEVVADDFFVPKDLVIVAQ